MTFIYNALLVLHFIGLASLLAWTVMLGKHYELKRLRVLNHNFDAHLRDQRSLLDLPESYRNKRAIPYGDLPGWPVPGARGHAGRLILGTLEGDMTALKGDYIIRGVAGELYPCKPDIFKATYDAVEEVRT